MSGILYVYDSFIQFWFLFSCRGTWNTPFFKPKVKKSLFSITRPKRFWWVDRNKLFYFCTQPFLGDKNEVTFVYGHLKTSLESSPGQDYTKTKNNIYINFFLNWKKLLTQWLFLFFNQSGYRKHAIYLFLPLNVVAQALQNISAYFVPGFRCVTRVLLGCC